MAFSPSREVWRERSGSAMQLCWLLLAAVLASSPARGHDDEQQHELMLGSLVGEYVLVGKRLDDDTTFLGSTVLARDGDGLRGFRKVDGVRVPVSATIEHPKCCEDAYVLRVRFLSGKRKLEATYLWRGDLDNQPRISGYVYEPDKRTDWPGMEVLFWDHRR